MARMYVLESADIRSNVHLSRCARKHLARAAQLVPCVPFPVFRSRVYNPAPYAMVGKVMVIP